MTSIIDIHKEELGLAFQQMGLEPPSAVLDRLKPCEDPRDPLVRSFLIYDFPVEDQTASLYIVVKENERNKWYIDQVHVYLEISSQRTEDGVVVFDRKFSLDKTPLPGLEDIRSILGVFVINEKEKEARFLQFNLQDEFVALGFSNYFEMLRSASQNGEFAVLHTFEKLPETTSNGIKAVRFEFVVAPPIGDQAGFLWMIRGSLVSEPESPYSVCGQAEQAFYKLGDHLPNKTEMVNDLVKLANRQIDTYEAVRRKFGFGDTSGPNDQGNRCSQGRLRL